MDNNNLFNTTPPGGNILNQNSNQGVNDLLTRGYNQPGQQNASQPAGGLYSSGFGQDAFALRESMQSPTPQPLPQPGPAQPVDPQYTGAQQNPYTQQNPPVQNQYTQPAYGQPSFSDSGYSQVPPVQPYNYAMEADVSVGEWVLSTILMMLPCVGFILLLTWAFGSNTPKSKQNWAKAMLIIMLIMFILSVAFAATAGIAFVRAFSKYMRYF